MCDPGLHPSPSPAYSSRQACPFSQAPLSLVLQLSSCLRLIEFSAWEGSGEFRGGAGWEEVVNRVGALPQALPHPPLPPVPPVEWGWSAGEGAWEENGPVVMRQPHSSRVLVDLRDLAGSPWPEQSWVKAYWASVSPLSPKRIRTGGRCFGRPPCPAG